MPSAADFIARSLRLLLVYDPTETPSSEDLDDGLTTLNQWMDDLALHESAVFYVARTAYNLVAGTAAYTIGVGGTFNQVRPTGTLRFSIIPDRTVAQPLELPIGPAITRAEYQAIAVKSATSSYPDRVYLDHNWAAGLATITVYPVPTSSLSQLVIYTPTPLVQFADLSTNYTFPPGYARAIELNLAIEIAPGYDKEPSPRVERLAAQALANIKRANVRPNEAHLDGVFMGRGGRGFNIYTGH